jgi:hypothetical protein
MVGDENEGQPDRRLEILYKFLDEYNETYDSFELEDDWWLKLQRKVYEIENNENIEELKKEGITNPIVDDYYSLLYLGQYRKLFERLGTVLKKENLTVYDYHSLYSSMLGGIINIIIDIANEYELVYKAQSEKYQILSLSIGFDTSLTLYDEKKKIDDIFNEYASKHETPPDKSIIDNCFNEFKMEYHKDADENDKKLLLKLATERPLIHKKLSSNGKYDMLEKRRGRAIARCLLENNISEGWGLVFMNKYINHEVDRSTIVNYFREMPKDIPLKNRNV